MNAIHLPRPVGRFGLTLLLLAAPATAQFHMPMVPSTPFGGTGFSPPPTPSVETVTRSIGPSWSFGNNDIAVGLGTGISASTTTIDIPAENIGYEPTSQSASWHATATGRLFGRHVEAGALNATATVRDGTWGYSNGNPVNYQPGLSQSASVSLRVLGMTIYHQNVQHSLSFNRYASYPLFGFTSPPFGVGPVSVRVDANVVAYGRYSGGMTIGGRSQTFIQFYPVNIAPKLHAQGRCAGWITGQLGVSLSAVVAEVGLTNEAHLGFTEALADFRTDFDSVDGDLEVYFAPLRLFARVWLRIGVGFLSNTWQRTLYDVRPFGGFSTTLGL